jgi:hypothetical protein
VDKDQGPHVEAKTDEDLYQSEERRNKDEGVHGSDGGLGAAGTFKVDIQPKTQDGVDGTLLHIEFHKNAIKGHFGSDGYAQPLAEETACLAKVLSANDPVASPLGLEVKDAGPARSLALADATPLKVLLRDPLFSKTLGKNSTGQTLVLEVAADVMVDGTVVIRRGALATGHLADFEKTKSFGRHAEIEIAFDSVTAVDGQKIPISGDTAKAQGGRKNDTMKAWESGPLGGLLTKGVDVFIRAGTSYDVAVSGQHTVKGGS